MNHQIKLNADALLTATKYPLLSSLLLAPIIILIFNSMNSTLHVNTISMYLNIVLVWAFFSGGVTLLGTLLIGTFSIWLLSSYGTLSSIKASLICGLIVYTISITCFGSFTAEWAILLTFYGLVCGYAFMYGYKKGTRK